VGITGQCVACTNNCKTCLNAINVCLTCNTNTYFLSSTSSCVTDCNPGLFIDYINQVCVGCTAPCATCTNSTTLCTSCTTGYLLNSKC
jgi:proprotein convertase subtilisin/kexin type 5